MSEISHESYQLHLWLLFTRHHPFDVFVFDNTLPGDLAADCLLKMLALTAIPLPESDAISLPCQPSPEEVAA